MARFLGLVLPHFFSRPKLPRARNRLTKILSLEKYASVQYLTHVYVSTHLNSSSFLDGQILTLTSFF